MPQMIRQAALLSLTLSTAAPLAQAAGGMDAPGTALSSSVSSSAAPAASTKAVSTTTSRNGPEQARHLSLHECIEIGLKNATSVLRATNTAHLSGEQLLQGYLQFAPNLTATGAYGDYFGNVYSYIPKPTSTRGVSSGLTYQLSSSINIFNGLYDISSLRAALAKQDAANLSLSRAQQQIAIDISQLYMQVILDKKLLDIANESLNASRHREELLAEQTKLGIKDIGNLYEQQAQTASDETNVVTTANRMQTSIMHLLQRLRLEGIAYEFVDPNLSYKPPYDESHSDQELVDKALQGRDDLKAASQTAKGAEETVTAARGPYYPRLDFSINMYGLTRTLDSQSVNGVDQAPFNQQSFGQQLRNNNNYSALLSASWSIFDRGVTHYAVEKATYDATNSKLDYEDLRIQVITEVKQAREDYRGAGSRLASAKRGVIAAAKSFERYQARYAAGAATFLDVLTAQVALAQAKDNEAQAQIDLGLQALIIGHVIGETKIP